MNYRKVYNQLINKRKKEYLKDCYFEKHHIKPKSLGGSNNKFNLVRLTAREHFIAHYLLAKMYKYKSQKWYKMNNAFIMMKCSSNNQYRYFNSRLYESLRINFKCVMSELQKGESNSQFGTIWITDGLCNKKIVSTEIIPNGWKKGRIFTPNKKYKELYYDFVNNYDVDSYNEFKIKHNLKCDFIRFKINCKKHYKTLIAKKVENIFFYNENNYTNKLNDVKKYYKILYNHYINSKDNDDFIINSGYTKRINNLKKMFKKYLGIKEINRMAH